MLVLVVLLAATAAATVAVGNVVRDEERRLLQERANEVVLVLGTTFKSAGTPLYNLVATTAARPADPAAFDAAATPLTKAGVKAAFLAAPSGPDVAVVAAVGDGPTTGTILGSARAALVRRALTASDFVSAVVAGPGGPRLVLALKDGSMVAGYETALDPTAAVPSTSTSPFHELSGIVYASTRADPSTVVLSQGGGHLSGGVVGSPVIVGADHWFVQVSARTPLVGPFAHEAPWIIIAVGLLATALATGLVETLGRRRLFALALVDERTASLRQREATLGAVFATSPDVIHVLDTSGRATAVSPAVERLLGYDSADLTGRPMTEIVDPSDRVLVADAIARLLARDADQLVVEYTARGNDGGRRVLESRAATLVGEDGSIVGIVAVSRDVTEQAQLAQDQRDARVAAEDANRSKSDFLSRMSHELRTPLNAVLGFAQLLDMDELSTDQHEVVDQILRGGRHLLDLINEVLDISRIETGSLALSAEPVAVADLVQEALELVAPLAAHRDIHLSLDSDHASPYVHADRQRLKQIVLNLLSNAVKYNRQGGQVDVGVESLDAATVRIRVNDTGPGIPEEKLGRLFTPFDRLGAEQTNIEGTGMGLALSRRLAESMGGQIGLDTTPGVGSTFWVDLPFSEGPVERYEREVPAIAANRVATAGSADHSADHSAGHTVVHIEDNAANLRLVERVLAQREGVHLVPAMQGRLGIELVREHHPDLVLLDLHLPDMNGDQVLRALRADPSTAGIPVVMLSADATAGQVERLLQAGANAYLTKPLDVRQLLDLVETVWAAPVEAR